jgi:hypothetical protein
MSITHLSIHFQCHTSTTACPVLLMLQALLSEIRMMTLTMMPEPEVLQF